LNQSQCLRLQCLQSFAHLQRRLDGFLKFFKGSLKNFEF
jgi:hypothetical protein